MIKRFKKLLLPIITAILLVSCATQLTGHQVLGKWEHGGSMIEFTEEGYFVKGSEKYPFSVDEEKITIDNNGEALVVDYKINSNGTMTMNGIIYYPVPSVQK